MSRVLWRPTGARGGSRRCGDFGSCMVGNRVLCGEMSGVGQLMCLGILGSQCYPFRKVNIDLDVYGAVCTYNTD